MTDAVVECSVTGVVDCSVTGVVECSVTGVVVCSVFDCVLNCRLTGAIVECGGPMWYVLYCWCYF